MSLKVIGAGFGRTGTASLKVALETLLKGPCYHMSEVVGKAGQMDLWLDAAAGAPNWDGIFDGYAATVDFPASNYWEALATHYPNAKVVLSLRDADRWFASTQDTIFSTRLQSYQKGTKWGRMCEATINDHIGGNPNNKDGVIAAFNTHNEKVKAAFGPERLLVFEAKDGWAPLCEFLDVPVPEQAYPHINSKEEFADAFQLLDSPAGAAMMNGDGLQGGPAHDDMLGKE